MNSTIIIIIIIIIMVIVFLSPVTNPNTNTIFSTTIQLCSSIHMNEDKFKISIT